MLFLCLSKPIAFLPFSLTSPSSLLKFPIISYGTAVLFISRQKRSINSTLFSKVPCACRTSITGKNRHGAINNHSAYQNRLAVLKRITHLRNCHSWSRPTFLWTCPTLTYFRKKCMFKRTILSFSRESTLFYNRNYLVQCSVIQVLLRCSLARENSQHFATPLLVFPRNDV